MKQGEATMSLEIKQIFLPNPNTDNEHVTYENKLQPCIFFEDLSLKALFEKHNDEIFKNIVREITDYVNDENTCNDDIVMFPRRCELTGEWYVGEIYFEDFNYLSVMTRFLGFHPNSKRMPIDDYLGLEVHFYYDEEQDKFIFDGIDSSCI
jgi:GTPase SAR1 family protein